MCKLTKNLLDFQDSDGGFDKGKGRNSGVETTVGAMSSVYIFSVSYRDDD